MSEEAEIKIATITASTDAELAFSDAMDMQE
jgi:hypothetical protein